MVTTSSTPNRRDVPGRPILVIYAGGTIGMEASSQGLAPARAIADKLRDALASLPLARRERLPAYMLWEAADPIDSSSATYTDWSRLASLIIEHRDAYSGFVILHGTDTLAWCASALAFQLVGIDMPIIVSGAQKPLGVADSDALENFATALDFVTQPDLREVALCFGGRLLRGCRARKCSTYEVIGFESPNWPILGTLESDRARLITDHCLPASSKTRLAPLPEQDIPTVLRLALWPGMPADFVERWLSDATVHGAIVECWGSGNLPQDARLLDSLTRATARGQILVAVSQCPHGGVNLDTYASGQQLLSAGVLSAGDMTLEAAHAKLTHLLGQPLDAEARKHQFVTPLAGERTTSHR